MPSSPTSVEIKIDEFVRDPQLQVRVRICKQTVSDFAEKFTAGIKFPPILLYRIDGKLLLVDGFHRAEAAVHAGRTTIRATITDGTRLDAFKAALGANRTHGLRLTNKDKRRAAEMAIREFPQLTDRALAKLAGVGADLIGDVRKSLLSDSDTSDRVRIGRNGKHYRHSQRKKLPPEVGDRITAPPAEPTPDMTLTPQQAHAVLIAYLERTRHEAEKLLKTLPGNLPMTMVQSFKLLAKQIEDTYRASLPTTTPSNDNQQQENHDNPITNHSKKH